MAWLSRIILKLCSKPPRERTWRGSRSTALRGPSKSSPAKQCSSPNTAGTAGCSLPTHRSYGSSNERRQRLASRLPSGGSVEPTSTTPLPLPAKSLHGAQCCTQHFTTVGCTSLYASCTLLYDEAYRGSGSEEVTTTVSKSWRGDSLRPSSSPSRFYAPSGSSVMSTLRDTLFPRLLYRKLVEFVEKLLLVVAIRRVASRRPRSSPARRTTSVNRWERTTLPALRTASEHTTASTAVVRHRSLHKPPGMSIAKGVCSTSRMASSTTAI